MSPRLALSASAAFLALTMGHSIAQPNLPPSVPPPGAASPALPAPGADQAFLFGLRRIGVLAGQQVVCTPEKEQADQTDKMADIGVDIATEYGVRAAFNFIGAAGYGAALPFDHADCPRVHDQWIALEKKYGDH